MPAFRKYETHPKIDMAVLMRHGLFDRARVAPLGFECGGTAMLIYYSLPNTELVVFFESEDGLIGQVIGMGAARRKSGVEPYLICPASGARCQELHLAGKRFVSRKEHPRINAKKPPPAHRRAAAIERMRKRVLGEDGRPPARGAARVALLSRLMREKFLLLKHPELGPHVEAYLRWVKAKRRLEARAQIDRAGRAEFEGKYDPRPFDLSVHLARSPQAWLDTITEPRDRFGNSPLAFIEGKVALDIRELAKRWKLDRQGIWAHRFNWDELKLILIVDFRDPDHPLLAVRDIQCLEGEPVDDFIIRLVPSAFKGRWFMECPLSGRRCDVLYWRDDVFASAKAVRYIHRSQRR